MSQAAYTFANITASSTDASLVTAVSGKTIVVYGLAFDCVGAPTDITFNSKGSGSGTAISATFSMSQNAGVVLPVTDFGWMETNANEGLTATTSAGSTVGVQVVYSYENVPGAQP